MSSELRCGPLFEDICSKDFLGFSFGGKSYSSQLRESIAKAKLLSGVEVDVRTLHPNGAVNTGEENGIHVVWTEHNFKFMGGSLGCAEGEKVCLAFEFARHHRIPIVVISKTGGARMQEGTSSLMQMAKVSVAVEALKREGIPFISVLEDPTYGGVPASYAMQGDVRIAVSEARIGFAGPQVILNTMFEMDQSKYDVACPDNFQSAEYVRDHGQLDIVVTPDNKLKDKQKAISEAVNLAVFKVIFVLHRSSEVLSPVSPPLPPSQVDKDEASINYVNSRKMDRYQAKDIIQTVFSDYVELLGDGRIGIDYCLKGGLARFNGQSCVVLGTFKGHTPQDMQTANYGMPSPHGYRTALKLMKLAERFNIPVVSLVDTCGAYPTFEAERDGQSEAIATNLTIMAGLRVPIITLVIGEGGSGGALGIAMGNKVGMLSQGYYGVISPEGAASILGRYKNDAHKAQQFPKDCQALATSQAIYAHQLLHMKVIDEILYEPVEVSESYQHFPLVAQRIAYFIFRSLFDLRQEFENSRSSTPLSYGDYLIEQRYHKFRIIGDFDQKSPEERQAIIEEALKSETSKREVQTATPPSKLVQYLAQEVLHGERSRFKNLAPLNMVKDAPVSPNLQQPAPPRIDEVPRTAKAVLLKATAELNAQEARGGKVDRSLIGKAVSDWVKAQNRVLVTDTTMRDAHQSLLATRVRSIDLLEGAKIANAVLKDAFSFECWGGATFDVSYRFLSECPWERLRKLSEACPNVCLQMLIRGSNAVGYTSYPDNVIVEFVRLAAKNGLDVFRIFDCFNQIDQMKVCIDAVREYGKIAEVCLCYTSDVLTSDIYNLDYYRELADQATKAGAHIIGIKDMAGLCRPPAVKPLIDAIRSVTDLPIHFHTHDTSSATLATALEMVRAGCDIVDTAVASMANCTSQPSLNAFCAALTGTERDPQIDYLKLEPYDMFWSRVRDMYVPFENGMKSGTARVYDHEIPGGQYSNLIVQCKAMGLWDKWELVLDMYRDVNKLLGDVVKVTPSSKCVGDLALYLVTRGLTADDINTPEKTTNIDFPESVIELAEGRLGFPHRGFPQAVQTAILKNKKPLTERPSAALPPANFEAKKIELRELYPETKIEDEEVISSILYPKVFKDYLNFITKNSDLVTYLSTPVFFYSFGVGQKMTMQVPEQYENLSQEIGAPVDQSRIVTVTLKRVGPIHKGNLRELTFVVNGVTQQVSVKDSRGGDVFDGPMADENDPSHIGSPMPGAVEKLFVKEGAEVKEGESVATISAMKMEVHVKAPFTGTVSVIHVKQGAKVIEKALIMKIIRS